jgi:hypothetical protein
LRARTHGKSGTRNSCRQPGKRMSSGQQSAPMYHFLTPQDQVAKLMPVPVPAGVR